MLLDIKSFFNSIFVAYEALPNEAKLIVFIIFILIFIVAILLIIMIEQKRLNKNVIDKKVELKDNTEVLTFDEFEGIDENNEKTRNLKEITDKIQAVIDNKAVDLTMFEQDQEENSIISYEELIKSVGKTVPSEAQPELSIPNLVRKIEAAEEIEKEEPYVEPPKESKFKASVFVSPVFGIQDPNRTTVVHKEEPVITKQVEDLFSPEYKEEETFLTSLKNFRKNLE